MWLASGRVQALGTALHDGRRDEVERLLEDVFAGSRAADEGPAACPTCRRDLVRTPLADVDLVVGTCPAGHGAWLSRAEGERLQALVGAHAAARARQRHVLRVLLVVLAAVWGVVLLVWGGEPLGRSAVALIEDLESRRITTTSWPARGSSGLHPLPVKESVIDRPDELLYFHTLLPLLEGGATNRVNMHRVLSTRRSNDEYAALYDLYRRRQTDVLDQLRRVPVPERLAEIHRRIVTATEQQIAFFGAFVEEKVKDPAIDLGRMLKHPALQTTSRELHTAWDLIRRAYPALDRPTSDAIESRLCQFDVI
ncbi:MAG TPA: hypothetical protein DDZ42_19065 [Candidatus Rokubacteria bacterium]|nr:MAG: hypothetical protein A2050_14245 [Candidatus Rokubacteria bacterium GWA2_73_35]HBH03983.1 hypothetical protein [Candidatus Rokubacteria bacterium]